MPGAVFSPDSLALQSGGHAKSAKVQGHHLSDQDFFLVQKRDQVCQTEDAGARPVLSLRALTSTLLDPLVIVHGHSPTTIGPGCTASLALPSNAIVVLMLIAPIWVRLT